MSESIDPNAICDKAKSGGAVCRKGDRKEVGCSELPDLPNDWNHKHAASSSSSAQGLANPAFAAAVEAMYELVDEINAACGYFHRCGDIERYAALRKQYNCRVSRIMEDYKNDRRSRHPLEWPTLLSDGKYITTFILQEDETKSINVPEKPETIEKPGFLASHSSSSVGWP